MVFQHKKSDRSPLGVQMPWTKFKHTKNRRINKKFSDSVLQGYKPVLVEKA